MSRYRYTAVFEAEDDADAKQQIWGEEGHPEWGASDRFEGIHTEWLIEVDTEREISQ